ncbi:bis(5'-nucleosyl)-tetraphosphatase (symmetrical) ApaH [Candidatus Purcelliella pentastirinorum]|uniref:bis(5'-nucleosyl)-tetraphosphatase (symmetrical) ApaH n=1 Tax=Candidatus Purcelliella pentastirinorum TaxID=472834 RepID=UPI0023685DBD|nr:bis(5'-nucleosyl)-tetraphosphatase (symmetrical) ApaH [Candidatus Purcelliella pentastirinorum]WDI79033.1 bis(5'-nucleosyl)-tetraphosphatase (symmetrical) ApaH [Candidatus Purcelliella pentastirinorum]WDR80171.1 bis(5'-nucleosyl)-tetraphosphatase (symmetrical) ApaH [Candidatus Purcelliella pentastirinorum]
MSNYFVGDIHGCYDELQLLLKKVFFNPDKDILWIAGDLVFKGNKSLDVLRYIRSLGKKARVVLGNNDLLFIAIYLNIIQFKIKENLSSIFLSDDIVDLVNWLRYQPFIQIDKNKKIILSHAGIHPKWDINTLIDYSKLINEILSSSIYDVFLDYIFNGKVIDFLFKSINFEKMNFILNVFTNMRYFLPDGRLELLCKLNPFYAPSHLIPWYLKTNVIPNDYKIIFGHWSSLVNVSLPSNIIFLDYGCCWGGYLTMFRWEDNKFFKIRSFLQNK